MLSKSPKFWGGKSISAKKFKASRYMLITTTGFFLLSYCKIKQAETCTGAKKGMRATEN